MTVTIIVSVPEPGVALTGAMGLGSADTASAAGVTDFSGVRKTGRRRHRFQPGG